MYEMKWTICEWKDLLQNNLEEKVGGVDEIQLAFLLVTTIETG